MAMVNGKWLLVFGAILALAWLTFALLTRQTSQNPVGRWFGKDEVLVFDKAGTGARYNRSSYPNSPASPFKWTTSDNQLSLSPGGDFEYKIALTLGGLRLTLKNASRSSSYNFD